MPLALNNNRGSVYSGRMKIEVLERLCLTVIFSCKIFFVDNLLNNSFNYTAQPF